MRFAHWLFGAMYITVGLVIMFAVSWLPGAILSITGAVILAITTVVHRIISQGEAESAARSTTSSSKRRLE
jgi:hypothetical protein